MKSLFAGLLVLSTIGLMQCSDKKGDTPEPVDLSSAVIYAEVDGTPFQADSTLTNVVLLPYRPNNPVTDQKTPYLFIYLYNKSRSQSIQMGIYDFKMKPGKIDHPVNTPDRNFDYTGITYYDKSVSASRFTTVGSTSPDWSIDITEFDQARHRVKGTFSGTLGTGANAVRITKGRFNAPYQVL